jgi:cytochrome c-type biogenesis protein
MEISISLAFLAGMASFLSPCVLSLVPAYIGYLSGRSIAANQVGDKTNRLIALSHGFIFVLGFSLIFIFFGLAISALGSLLFDIRDWLTKIGGVVVILFGLHITGIIRIPFLDYDLRPASTLDHSRSYFSSFLLGIFFSAGWSPCVGPVLGSILTLALNGGSILIGFYLLLAYSAGMAIPFLIAALGIGWVTTALRRYQKTMHYFEIGMGIILIFVGIMLFIGAFNKIATFGSFFDLGL